MKNIEDNIIYNYLIKINRNLSEKSIKTYTNILTKLYIYFNGELKNDFEPYFFIENYMNIIEYLLNNIDNKYTRKTIIAAILNILRYYDINDKKIIRIKKLYSDIMYDDTNEIKKLKETNEKNNKEKLNWIEYNNIIEIFNNMYKKYYMYFNIKDISNYLIDELQNLIILSMYIFIEPRRLEYVDLKYKSFDKETDNYIDIKNKKIVLNNYKTSKLKGIKIFDINNKIFLDLLNKFIILKKNNNIETEYLFNSINGNKLQPSQLTKRINNIFGKNISVSMIRKAYLSHHFKNDIDTLKKLDNITDMMGNSSIEALRTYIKK